MAADGEGATKLLEVVVTGAPDRGDRARLRALDRLVAAREGGDLRRGSELGPDPLDGGRAGRLRRTSPSIRSGRAVTCRASRCSATARPSSSTGRSSARACGRAAIDVLVELAEGEARAVAWGCDLSYDYVKINADYTSLIFQKPDGGVAKDDRVSNYSPAFKRALLVEALKYIAAFSGQIAVIKYGGAAMVKDSLKEAFAEDVMLLKKVGLKPIVVHGGAPEITRTLEKLGERSEFVDGMRVTDAQSLPVVEMVLTGKVNQELVALLNARNAGAVGLSGKDGRLLRAKKAIHESGRDLGHVGEVVEVNREFLQMLLDGGYVPVISPIGLSDEGGEPLDQRRRGRRRDRRRARREEAHLPHRRPRHPRVLARRRRWSASSPPPTSPGAWRPAAMTGGMKWKAQSILAALAGGVERVHVLDGRQPHTVIAELFTDRGVGSLVERRTMT